MAVQIIGRKVGTPNQVIVRLPDGDYTFPKYTSPLQTDAQINPHEYALVQEGDKVNITADSAISMAQMFDGMQFSPANKEALKKGLVVSTPTRFMRNIINTNGALNEKEVLYDAAGNLIEGDRLIKYADRLNKDCWVYLNARFPQEKEKDTGFLGLDLVTIVRLDKDRLISIREPLQPCLEDACYAELESLNSQGLATKKAGTQKYVPGKTVHFYPPILRKDNPKEGHVARFVALADRAGLICYGNPAYSDAGLGAFLCAEGAEKNL